MTPPVVVVRRPRQTAPAEKDLAFHSLTLDAVFDRLDGNRTQGLSGPEAASRLDAWGPNVIGEGRSIFDNVRLVIQYLPTTNACEVLVMIIGFLVFESLGEPLLATQILWVNLVTDGLPVLALAADPPSPDRMRWPPQRDRSIVRASQLWSLL